LAPTSLSPSTSFSFFPKMSSEEEEAAAATTELKGAAAAIAEPKGAAAKFVPSPCIARSAAAARAQAYSPAAAGPLTRTTSDDVQMLQDSWLTQQEASPSTSLATGSILSFYAAPLAMLFACGIRENIFDICCY
jgi:hypothetical protein